MSIYVVTHKKYNIPKMKGYIPIQVGASLHENLGYKVDSDGDNISDKNPNYCELTALYYMWKNLDDDIIGLTHYRRYFCDKMTSEPLKHILSYDTAKSLLKKYDVIVPYKMHRQGKTIREDYAEYHNVRDYDECGKIIKEFFPEYKRDFVKVSKSKDLYQFNMLITKKKYFDEYCNWLFTILFELEKRIDISDYDAYNSRIYGFLSERLFNAIKGDVVVLEDIGDVVKGKQINGEFLSESGKYYVMNGGIEPSGFYNDYNVEANTISISEGGNSCGYVQFNACPFWSGGHCYTIQNTTDNVKTEYLYQFLKSKESEIMKLRIGSGLPNIQKKDLAKFKITIPNISEQKVISAFLSSFERKADVEMNFVNLLLEEKQYLLRQMFI